MNRYRFQNGFSIIELIIAGAISMTAIGVGFSLLQINLRGNKINETQMGLNGRINDTLDFILDEVKASKRIIDSEEEIKIFNTNCTYPNESIFLFGISIPDQALGKSDYSPKGDKFNLNQIECPIVYSLKEIPNKKSFSLIRFGPTFNKFGYYISPSYIEFKETKLLDGVSSKSNYNKIICPIGWKDIKTIKGISFCVDRFRKAIELQIVAKDNQNKSYTKEINSLASIGGFSSIQDENQINRSTLNSDYLTDYPLCQGGRCCLIGICLKSNKITYLIDYSYYMNKDYLHLNGEIEDGNWKGIKNPEFISPLINGRNLFEFTINNLKKHIQKLPSSNLIEDKNKIFIQIIANNSNSNYLFENGPSELTIENKNKALEYLNNLEPNVIAAIDPWEDICNILESEFVGQLVVLSGWKPEKNNASFNKECAGKTEGKFAEIIEEYNQFTRSESATGALVIDSISIYNNFCEKSKNPFNNNWLGRISNGPESFCIHIK